MKEKVLNLAAKYIGTSEQPDNNIFFNTQYYGHEVSGSQYPWCCVFVWYVFREAGLSKLFCDSKKVASCLTAADWFKSKNQWYTKPQVGDIVFFKFSNKNSRYTDHVGFVEKVNKDGTISTIEGNTSDKDDRNGGMVKRRQRTMDNVVGFGRPKYDSKKSIDEIVAEVKKGLWGNGAERKQRLEAAGYNYEEVRVAINASVSKNIEHISQRGIDFIVQKEGGYKLTAYKLEGEDMYTIGVGHHSPDVLPNMTISRERAEELFKLDIQKFERYVKQYATIPLTQGRFDALVSYTYNRGLGGLKELMSNCHTSQEVYDGLVKYWGKNTKYRDALIKRRKEEQVIFLS